jgi:hypothetical protein
LVIGAFDRVLTNVRPGTAFTDVPRSAIAAIARIYRTGVMSGLGDATFRPNGNIRRQGILVALVTILGPSI